MMNSKQVHAHYSSMLASTLIADLIRKSELYDFSGLSDDLLKLSLICQKQEQLIQDLYQQFYILENKIRSKIDE